MASYINSGDNNDALLWPLLQTRTVADDAQLPHTGIPRDLERALSATFIATPDYGTRACSIVRIHTEGVRFSEQRFGPQGALGNTVLNEI